MVQFNLEVRITAGYPLKNVLVREAIEVNATWVILDWHLRGRKDYFMDKLECSLVLMAKNSDFGKFLRISSLGNCAPIDRAEGANNSMSRSSEFTLVRQNASGYSSSRVSVNSDAFDQLSPSNFSDRSFSSMYSMSDGG